MKLNFNTTRLCLTALLSIISLIATAQVNQWTWISGSNTNNSIGTYGTQGTGSVNNIPGGRSRSASWQDASGNFWLFGGNGLAVTNTQGFLNDLWKFNRATRQWTWVKGDSAINVQSVYGTKGVAADSCKPGARYGCVSWTDATGNFWLFGGIDNTNTRLSELWRYTPLTNRWTWIGGDTAGNNHGVYGTMGTANAANVPGARYFATNWIDNQNNLWLLGGNGYGNSGNAGDLNDLWKYSTTTNQWTWVKGDSTTNSHGVYGTMGTAAAGNMPGAREYAMKWRVGNTLWLFGGYGYGASGNVGALNDIWSYGIGSGNWTWINGDSLTGQSAVYGTQGVFDSANHPRARGYGMSWLDATGNFWMFGGTTTPNGGTTMNDLWKYSRTTNQWAWVNGDTISNQGGTYGTMGTPSIVNTPGARRQMIGWVGPNDSLWLFGGRGYGTNAGAGTAFLNDLWKNAYQAAGTNPVISSFTPTSAPTNDTVTIVGINFTNVTGVTFGTKRAKSFTIVSPDTIQAVVGNGAAGYVAVYYATGADSLAGFTLAANRFFGTVDSLWSNADNWEGGLLPNDSANVTLSSQGVPTRIPILDVDVIVNNMVMNRHLDLNGHSLTAVGNITTQNNNRVFLGSATSDLIINGNAGTISFDATANSLRSLQIGVNASCTVSGELVIVGP